ncbi:MAG: DUF3320 domain-containing protein, partial [Planctomycetota bacterium]|jgi:very-short-patch-repair endonuclease
VTFNQAQQTLVEDLLEKARREDPGIERFFGDESPEPVFVKNLENVQGDERDVILFSVCYGPDKQGRISMNFGPMNRDGGERRLNVAVTRARREVLVFSSMRADQIDLARSRARGVRDLKTFLEYAEFGTPALPIPDPQGGRVVFPSPFEEDVGKTLEALGFTVHRRVGCSGYRIDLAVVDPEDSGWYLLGIACDGPNYANAQSARDRDLLRDIVLRNLGWEIHRVWCTDWLRDREGEVEKLKKALVAAKKKQRAPKPKPSLPPKPESPRPEPAGDSKPAIQKPGPQAAPDPPTAREHAPTEYTPVTPGKPLGDAGQFHDEGADGAVGKMLLEVVKREGPVHLPLASRRVAAFWGIERITRKVVERVASRLPLRGVHEQETSGGVFLWPKGTTPEGYRDFRVPGSHPDSVRESEDFPAEELANAALHVLRGQIGLPEGDLIRETAQVFGFHRAGRILHERIQQGIGILVQRGDARREREKVVLSR